MVKGGLERLFFFFKRVCPKRFKYWGNLPVCSEMIAPDGGCGFLKPSCYIQGIRQFKLERLSGPAQPAKVPKERLGEDTADPSNLVRAVDAST